MSVLVIKYSERSIAIFGKETKDFKDKLLSQKDSDPCLVFSRDLCPLIDGAAPIHILLNSLACLKYYETA